MNWYKLLALTVVLLALVSCKSRLSNLKPPPEPDRYVLPPESDQRYVQPVSYPRETLHEDPFSKQKRAIPGGRPGMGPRNRTGFP